MLMKTTVTSSPSLAGTSGITLDSLRVSYHGNVVLKPLSLTIEPGEVLALIGPSGSGKTTVLRAIAGFVQPAGGRILIGDTDVTQLPPYKRGLAMVVQNYALFPHMKVEDNVAFGLRAQKQPRGLIAERVTEALKIVGMADYATRYPHQLSGGQQQRVAIARAIAVRPRVLLLDEPLSALDAQIRHNMVEEIARLHRELPELTILYVTHDQTEALTLADKIGIMKDGSLIAHGETHELYHYPPNRFSAEFLGRANILQATALKDSPDPGLVSVSCGGGLINAFSRGGLHGNNKLLCIRPHPPNRFSAEFLGRANILQATALKDSPDPGLVSVSCGGGLINAFSRGGLHGNNKLLCIRPQHMSLAPRSATSNRLNATLTSVHWQGDLTHLLCDVAGEAVRIVMTQVNPLPRAGDKLSLYFEPGDAVLIEVQ
ncbi:2-aminoethylphosphonate ABC transport system ATP-binding subunit PhnT [Klebsiella pneumoniae]